MKTIYKYSISIKDGLQAINMLEGATILHVGFLNKGSAIWAEVDDSKILELRHFIVYATGERHLTKMQQNFIGTWITRDGDVYHLYEVIIPEINVDPA